MTAKRRADGPAVKKAPKRPLTRKQKVTRFAKWFALFGLVGVLLMAATFVALYQVVDVPEPNEEFQTQTSFVFYEDGKTELGRFATQDRTPIKLDEMPDHLQDAVVAAENQSFWTDKGIDPKGILRAAFSNASGGTTQGASTITQQYVKILYLSQERSYRRKVKEAILSLKIQRQQSKRQILEGYLNTIYFGRGAYGVQAAAQAYFDKPATKLDLRESVVLARVLNNPTAYDPANGKQARRDLKSGFDFILDAMVDTGSITGDQAEKAKKRLPKFPEMEAESTYGGQRGHMLALVKKELVRLGFSEEEIDGQGLRVVTTIDPDTMTAIEQGVQEVRPKDFPGAEQLHIGAAAVEPGTGALRGFFGGQDYLDSQINWSVAGGQGGSTLKAFTLAAAIKDGFSLRDTFEGNSPIEIGGDEFENQGDQDYGSAVNMITATENSVNTAFLDMTDSMENGPEKIVKTANAMGIPPKEAGSRRSPGFPNATPGLEPDITVGLGSATVSPINMAVGYATLANEGVYAEPYLIEKVLDADGKDLYTHKVQDERALDEDIAADVSYALQQVVKTGSGTAALELGRPAAGKTGTATNGKGEVSSAWFAGYTPQLATTVMYVRGKGNEQLQGWLPASPDGREGYFGGNYPARTWTAIMEQALEGLPIEDFPPPVYVDGDAPDDGHAPTIAPVDPPDVSGDGGASQPGQPQGTRPPTATQEPSEEPTTEAPPTTAPPTTAPPTTQEPTDCTILGNCPTEEPTDEPSETPPPSSPNPSASARQRARRRAGAGRRR